MNRSVFIGIDLGTSAVKLLLVDQQGTVLNTVSREYCDIIILGTLLTHMGYISYTVSERKGELIIVCNWIGGTNLC